MKVYEAGQHRPPADVNHLRVLLWLTPNWLPALHG